MSNLKEKILVFGVTFFLFMAVSSVIFNYSAISRLHTNTISAHLLRQTEQIAVDVGEILDKEVRSLFCAFKNPEFIQSFSRLQDLRSSGDKNYQPVLIKPPASLEVANNSHGRSGQLPSRQNPSLLPGADQHDYSNSELFIADRQGFLLAATTPQAPGSLAKEEWWHQVNPVREQSSVTGSVDGGFERPSASSVNNHRLKAVTFSNGVNSQGKGKIYIGPIQRDPATGNWFFLFAGPIEDNDGKVIGFFKKILMVQDILKSIILSRGNNRSDYDLVFIDGVEKAFSSLPEVNKNYEQSFLEVLGGKQAASQRQWLTGKDLKGQKAIITYAPISTPLLTTQGLSWGISLTYDIVSAFAPLRQMLFQQIRFTIIVILVAVTLILIFSRKLVGPILTLQSAMQKASTGDLSVRAEVKTGDEIEQLAATFNWMISDLKTSQHEITERKVFFENIVNNMSDTLVVLYNDGTIRAINKQLLVLLGYTEEELIHKPVEILFQEGESFDIIRQLLETIKKNPKQTVKVRYRTKDLQSIAIHLSCNLVRDKHNQVDGLVLVGTDLREQLRMIDELDNSRKQLTLYSKSLEEKVTVRTAHLEKALNEAQEMKQIMLSILEDFDENRREMERIKAKLEEWNDLMQTLVASLNEGVIMLDDRGEVTVFNPMAKILLGFKIEDELDGQQVIEYLKSIGLDIEFVQSWQGQKIITKEIKLKTAPFRLLHIDISPVLKDQTIIGLALSIRDITREKEIDRMKTDFISTVSHELRTPLTCIREAIAQIVEGIKGEVNAGQREFLHIAIEELDRLTRIITDLLDISKIEAGRVVLHRQETDLVPLIQEVVKTLSVKAREKQITITEEFALPSCVLYVDPDRIKQVLTNLLSNAIKFTEPQGTVIISLREKTQEVECAVADSGRGIAPENLLKIFDRFEQIDWAFSARPQGTGLGLPISKALVEIHQGVMRVQSAVGQGSTFSFVFPKLSQEAMVLEIMKEAMNKAKEEYEEESFIFIGLKEKREGGADIMNVIASITHHTVRRSDDLVLQYKNSRTLVVMVRSPKGGACTLRERLAENIKEAHIGEDCVFVVSAYPEEIHSEEDLQKWLANAEKLCGGSNYGSTEENISG